jgi:hypothetical protein
MISSFSDADTSCLVLPIPDHAFFEQAVFQGQVGNDLLERGDSERSSLTSGEVA